MAPPSLAQRHELEARALLAAEQVVEHPRGEGGVAAPSLTGDRDFWNRVDPDSMGPRPPCGNGSEPRTHRLLLRGSYF
jgi:hypothetical protein